MGIGPASFGLRPAGSWRVGPSAFDLAPDGSVVVLDQVNDRLATYPAAGGGPRYLPILFDGGEGDVALGEDGTAYVLDPGVSRSCRSYADSGARIAVAPVSGSDVDMLRATSTGAALHGYPERCGCRSEVRTTCSSRASRPLVQGRAAPDADGSEVVVSATDEQASLRSSAETVWCRHGRSRAARTSARFQLAEPYGNGLLVVLRVWTSQRAEFVALVLSANGL